MKKYLLIGFVVLAIIVLIFITRQQRERFTDPNAVDLIMAVAKRVDNVDKRVTKIEEDEKSSEDQSNAAAGQIAMTTG